MSIKELCKEKPEDLEVPADISRGGGGNRFDSNQASNNRRVKRLWEGEQIDGRGQREAGITEC